MVKQGDAVTQGQIIGLSGKSKLETGKTNNLLFEAVNDTLYSIVNILFNFISFILYKIPFFPR